MSAVDSDVVCNPVYKGRGTDPLNALLSAANEGGAEPDESTAS